MQHNLQLATAYQTCNGASLDFCQQPFQLSAKAMFAKVRKHSTPITLRTALIKAHQRQLLLLPAQDFKGALDYVWFSHQASE